MATIAIIAIALVLAAASYVLFVQEHPVTGIEIESDREVFDVSVYYTVTAEIQPALASDRGIVWSVDNPDVTLEPDGERLRFIISPALSPGEKFTITAFNDRYGITSSREFSVTGNLSMDMYADSDSIAYGKSVEVHSGIPSRYHDAEVVWTSSIPGVEISGDSMRATVTLGGSVSPGTVVRISAYIPGSDISDSVDLRVLPEMYIDASEMGGVLQITSLHDYVEVTGDGRTVLDSTVEIRDRTSPLTLVLNGVGLRSSTGSAAIECSSNAKVEVVVRGNVNIYGNDADGRTSGSEGIKVSNLSLVLEGSLYVTGGRGSDGAVSIRGSNGFSGIASNTVTITGNGSLTSTGGMGGDGGDGLDSVIRGPNGTDATESSPAVAGGSGSRGADGAAGGDGGAGISATRISLSSSTTVVFTGGKGGTGGDGGNGSKGGDGATGYNILRNDLNGSSGGTGGNGGNGGPGGNGGKPSTVNVSSSRFTGVQGAGGDGGSGGDGGRGGNGGDGGTNGYRWAGVNDAPVTASDGGSGGRGGDGGNGGSGGNGSVRGNNGSAGNGGLGGDGGEAGYCENTRVASTDVVYGNDGPDGRVGSKGAR